jgi:hypothetical protein
VQSHALGGAFGLCLYYLQGTQQKQWKALIFFLVCGKLLICKISIKTI